MTTKLKKLSIKSVSGLSKEQLKEVANSDNTKVAQFAGEAHGYGKVQTQYGESIFITGMIVAQNMQTGETFQSGKAFLPQDFTDQLVAQLDGRKDSIDTVEFGVLVSVTATDKNYGYEYVSEAIQTPDTVKKQEKYLGKFAALTDQR